MTRKPKLSVPQQIRHMEEAGITFEHISKAEATRFLQYNTYYFKLKAYAKNFTKYKNGERAGKYFNLDLGQFTRNYTQTTKRGLLTTNKG